MKETIINKAKDLFLNLGFKSVTMDEIANELGISKKTIYVHFANKTKLIEAVSITVFNEISEGINQICGISENPISEIYHMKEFVMKSLKYEKSSPQYQLQKYYPKIFRALKKKQFEITDKCVKENLSKGIKSGIYRSDLDNNFIARIYFHSLLIIKDKDLFPDGQFEALNVFDQFIDYHLHGICTEKGLEILKTLKTNQETAL